MYFLDLHVVRGDVSPFSCRNNYTLSFTNIHLYQYHQRLTKKRQNYGTVSVFSCFDLSNFPLENMGNGISRAPKKTFSQIPQTARDPPSCAYLNRKTTLRPWKFLINYRPNTKKVIELIARWPMVSYQLHLLTNAFRRIWKFVGIRKDKISFFPNTFSSGLTPTIIAPRHNLKKGLLLKLP